MTTPVRSSLSVVCKGSGVSIQGSFLEEVAFGTPAVWGLCRSCAPTS